MKRNIQDDKPQSFPVCGLVHALKIPLESLSESALAGVIEAFVLREGTDYGEVETPFADKCAEVRRQLEAGEAWINFDPSSDTIDLRAGPVSDD